MEVSAPALRLRVRVDDQSAVGEARRSGARLAERIGLEPEAVARVALVATELGTNLVKHARGGEILLQQVAGAERPQLELLAIDRGPGANHIERWFHDGYTTGSSPGTGLGAVVRQSEVVDGYSVPGRGTVLMARIGAPSAPVPLEIGAVCVPREGETACGDDWGVVRGDGRLVVMVVDGLGHGPAAAEAAGRFVQVFEARPFAAPSEVLALGHQRMTGSRGAAVAVAQVLPGKVVFSGVGNISGGIEGAEARGLPSANGTLGVAIPRLRDLEFPWSPDDQLLVLHSDGLSARWRLADHPGLSRRHPAVVAGVLYRDQRRERDDATVVVVGRGRRT